jgi:hypothetical protein
MSLVSDRKRERAAAGLKRRDLSRPLSLEEPAGALGYPAVWLVQTALVRRACRRA